MIVREHKYNQKLIKKPREKHNAYTTNHRFNIFNNKIFSYEN